MEIGEKADGDPATLQHLLFQESVAGQVFRAEIELNLLSDGEWLIRGGWRGRRPGLVLLLELLTRHG